jgi:uncharacterized cupredoxin-like copper-binding protein
MTGMMASMTMGMTLGLGVGTLIPGHLFDNLFHSSAAGMLIGGIAGALIGLPISMMAVLDGLLAGIMSGMMGPMLIGMIPEASADTAVKFVLVLCAGSIFLLFIMLQQEIKPERLKRGYFLLQRQAPMFILVVSFLLLSVQTPLSKSPSFISADHAQHNGQVQHQEQSPAKIAAISVRASEFQFSPIHMELNSSQTYRLALKNTGKIEHDFEIIGTSIHVHTKPGETKMVEFTIDKPGLYKAVCTLPGHLEAGMVTPIQVL